MSSKLVLVLNCGSSSLKFAILDAVNGDEYLSGLAECFHLPEARIKWKIDGGKQEAELGAGAAHSEALLAPTAQATDHSDIATRLRAFASPPDAAPAAIAAFEQGWQADNAVQP